MAMHAAYEEKQGGYGHFDKTYWETNVFGAAMLQFRRFIAAIVRHGFQSYGKSYAKGRYQNTGEVDADGNIVYNFEPKMVEGKWVTMLGVFTYYLTSKNIMNNNYKWENLDQGQIENFVDAFYTIITYGMLTAIAKLGFGDLPEDDPHRKLAEKVLTESLQHWAMFTAINDMVDKPPAYQLLSRLCKGTADLSIALILYGVDSAEILPDDSILRESYMTREDELKGLTLLEDNLPVYTNVRDSYEFFIRENGEE